VVTDTPTGARFEKLILFLTATSDHHIKNYNKFLLQAMEGLGFREPAQTQLAAPVAQTLSRTESVDREGMAVEDEGKPSGKRGKLRPRRSYEITLQGTSSNVESYSEEIASIGSEEGEERTERAEGAEGRERIGRTECTGRTESMISKQTEVSGRKEELERNERAGTIEGRDGTKGTGLNGRKGDTERAEGNGRNAEMERTHRTEPADGMAQAERTRSGHGTESTERPGQGGDSPPGKSVGGLDEKCDGTLQVNSPRNRPSQERRDASTVDGGKVRGEVREEVREEGGERRGDEAQESCARELSEVADSADPVESPGARQAPSSCSEESPGSKRERRGETTSAPFLKRFFFWGNGGERACENSER
jgi:hypothetical protein